MTFEFFLPESGTLKNINLKLRNKQGTEIFSFRTQLKISDKDWDKEKQRPKNIYLKKCKKLNAKLDKIKKEVSGYIRNQQLKNKQPTKREISKEIKKICLEETVELSRTSFLYFTQWYIDYKEELICNSTYKRYKVFFRLLERFEGFICKKLNIEEVNSDFVRDFLVFGKAEEYSENTIYRTIHFVKTILNFAERKGIRTCVRELEIRREKQSKQMITLSETEIKKIEQTDIPKELQPAKDWLLISCYTGQRFSDFMNFDVQKLNSIKGKCCLFFEQQKTKKEIILPLHRKVLEIITKNGGNFPPFLANHIYNEPIKQVGKYADICEIAKARKRIGFRTKDIETEKYNVLTSHIGRRSFATNFYGKIPTPLLMEATGHSTEQMFLRYINPQNDERVLALGDYFDRVFEERVAV